MKDHSQSKEQAIILDFFKDFRGTALDCGANDGLTFSNSRALVELGWNAVLVEPAPTAFRKLVDLYDSPPAGESLNGFQLDSGRGIRFVQCIQAAITTQDGPIQFHSSGTHLKKGDTDLLSTTRPEEMARWKKSGEVFTETTVRGITFETLMKETGVRKFEFISIDCEGVDLAILEQIDLTAVGCRLLCIEVNRADQAPFDAHCAKHGMKLMHRNWENAIYSIS